MRASVITAFDTRLALSLFTYGAVVHLLMYRVFGQPADPELAKMHSLAIFMLGGIVELALFYRPARHAWTSRAHLLSGMALVGLFTTFLVIEIALVTLASVATLSAWHELKQLPFKEGLSMFGLMVLSVHVYEFSLFFYLLPLGAVQGVVAGILVQRFRLIAKVAVQ